VKEPVSRRGVWWQEQDDGTWLRWNEGAGSWEPSATPPPPDDSGLPPVPPTPGQMAAGYGGRPMTTGAAVPNYMVWAILVTIFCFLPTGIAAIVFASQVGTKLAAGDRAGAIESSRKAKMWCIISAAIGAVFVVIAIAVSASTTTTTSYFGP
jgi:Interferon-induced transmembrane protein